MPMNKNFCLKFDPPDIYILCRYVKLSARGPHAVQLLVQYGPKLSENGFKMMEHRKNLLIFNRGQLKFFLSLNQFEIDMPDIEAQCDQRNKIALCQCLLVRMDKIVLLKNRNVYI